MSNQPDRNELRERIIAAIRTVMDPEIPVNIYDLGLIYDIDIDEAAAVRVRMTLTTPNCPVADALPSSVKQKVREVEGVGDVAVELTWDPSWTPEKMTEEAKAAMDMMGIDAANPAQRGPFTGLSVGRTERQRRNG